jgi:pyruvate-formate lyase-activating enzyme
MSFRSDFIRHGVLLARAVAPYLTAAKLRNSLQCEAEALRRAPEPRAFPYIAILDLAGICNLRCRYCPTGVGRDSGRKPRLISPSLIDKLLAELGRYLVSVNLYNWGEPLLHPQLPEIVRRLHQNRIFTSVSTNLNTARRDYLADLCDAGLDHLLISISGASQEVYERYHRLGNYGLVLDNLKFLADYKRQHRLQRPLIEVKYLMFTFNRHEVQAAARLAQALSVDLFRTVPGGGAREAKVRAPGEQLWRTPFPSPWPCHHLWDTLVLRVDGGVAPCCYTFFKADDFGDFSKASQEDIRLGDRFIQARSLFNPRRLSELPPDLEHPCLKCHLVHEQRHLQPYLRGNPHAVRGCLDGGP